MGKKRAAAAAEQSKLFIEKAREIGCDETADEDEVMRRLARQKKKREAKPSRGTKPKKGDFQ